MFTVTSAFKSLSESTNPFQVNLKFTFSGSEETVRLLKATNISRSTQKFSAGRLTVNLANTDTTSPVRPSFNILQSDKTHFFRKGVYNISFSSSAGGESEDLALFTGKLVTANFRQQRVTLTFLDIYDDLKKRTIGDASDAVQFIGSLWNPADLFWSVVVSYGGLSSLQSISNPDIDYASFLSWKAAATAATQAIQAEFKGTTVVDAIDKIADITNSVIVGEGDGKIYTSLVIPTLVSSAVTLSDSVVFNIDLNVDTNRILNKGSVLFGFDTTSATFANSFTTEKTSSINTYGQHETIFSDTTVWHATKQSAQFFLETNLALLGSPISEFRVDLGYTGVPFQLNDAIFIIDEPLSVDGTVPYTITGLEFNAGRGSVTITAQERQNNNHFFLDHAVLGLLDKTNNPLF